MRTANPQIPWRLIVATRNRLIHGYLGIDDDTLWSIVQGDVPPSQGQTYAEAVRALEIGASGSAPGKDIEQVR